MDKVFWYFFKHLILNLNLKNNNLFNFIVRYNAFSIIKPFILQMNVFRGVLTRAWTKGSAWLTPSFEGGVYSWLTVKSLTNEYECIELIEVNIWQLYSYIQAKVQALVKMTNSSTWYIYYIVVLLSGLMLLHPLFYNPHTCTDILLGKPFFKYLSHTLMINEHDCCLGFSTFCDIYPKITLKF